MRASSALAVALAAAGCAATGSGPPDTAADVGRAVGGVATTVLRQLPVVNTALATADDVRGRAAEALERRRAAAADARRVARAFAFCASNPCMGDCPRIVLEQAGVAPDCGDAHDTHRGTAPPGCAADLRTRLMAAEGRLLVEDGEHVCHGHAVTAAERRAGVFNPESGGRIPLGFPMSAPACGALLDEDIAEARTEALRVFGLDDDARAELCFWRRCADFRGTVDLAAAVASDAGLLAVDPHRARRIARCL